MCVLCILCNITLTMDEAVALVLASDSEDEEVNDIQNSKEVDIIYVPPPVTVQSDDENIDDNIIEREDNVAMLMTDIAGEVELKYRCRSSDDEDYVPDPVLKKKRNKSKKGKILAKEPKPKQSALSAGQPQPSTSSAGEPQPSTSPADQPKPPTPIPKGKTPLKRQRKNSIDQAPCMILVCLNGRKKFNRTILNL